MDVHTTNYTLCCYRAETDGIFATVTMDPDNAVKEYIRMRGDAKDAHKRIKQQLLAFCARNGKWFTEGRNYWTKKRITVTSPS